MPRTLNTAADVWWRIDVGDSDDDCWPFIGALTTGGYGTFWFDGRHHQAHRVAYASLRGPIPAGLQLDHLCRNRRCCNPSHLEPVTALENVNRSPEHHGARTHCPQGHPYDGANLRRYRNGRYCRECMRVDSRERKRRTRESNAALGLTTRGTERKCLRTPTVN